jgi:hypothetical protein
MYPQRARMAGRNGVSPSCTLCSMRGVTLAALTVLSAATGGCGSGSNQPVSTPSPTASASATARTTGTLTSLGTPARQAAAFGFDPVSGRLLLQGGSAQVSAQSTPPPSTAETWSWDGVRWTQLHPAVEPPALANSMMAVDPTTNRLVLVGGRGTEPWTPDGPQPPQHGMWSWDGANWSRVAGGDPPLQLTGGMLTADPGSGELLLNGVTKDGAANSQPGAFTWNGRRWATAPVPSTPDALLISGCEGAGLGWDPISRRMIQFGGGVQQPYQDTAAWDGHQWSFLAPATVPPQGYGLAATDVQRGQLVMVAGSLDGFNRPTETTTWTWNGRNWTRVGVGSEPSPGGSLMVYDPTVHAIVAYGYLQGIASLWVWDGRSWTRLPSA